MNPTVAICPAHYAMQNNPYNDEQPCYTSVSIFYSLFCN